MQLGLSSEKNVRVIYAPDWGALPIQPPTGYWWRLLIMTLAALMVMAILAISSVSGIKPTDWMVSPVLIVGVVPGMTTMVIGVIAGHPYRAERRLGYTTWPAEKEMVSN